MLSDVEVGLGVEIQRGVSRSGVLLTRYEERVLANNWAAGGGFICSGEEAYRSVETPPRLRNGYGRRRRTKHSPKRQVTYRSGPGVLERRKVS